MANGGEASAEHSTSVSYNRCIKVHGLMCLELEKFIDRISQIHSDAVSARPRCTEGVQALCSLLETIDKAKLLFHHCSDASKLYLAITADTILLRCRKIQNSFNMHLGRIQNLAPTLLAKKISGVIKDLKCAKFQLKSSEVKAGKVLRELIKQGIPKTDSINILEFEAIQYAAVELKITSPTAVLEEKRSVKRLYDKVCHPDPKKAILSYLHYLLNKYEELIRRRNLSQHHQELNSIAWDENEVDESASPEPPQEFKCPGSMRLMYDPVIIASGKTYERVWIEKWFEEGNEKCPITHVSLENLFITPNSALKGLISKWCLKHGGTVSDPSAHLLPTALSSQSFLLTDSVASFGSSMNNLCIEVGSISSESSDVKSVSALSPGSVSSFDSSTDSVTCLTKLSSLPWGSQCKLVQNVKEQLHKNDPAWIVPNSHMKPLIKFLNESRDRCDVEAQNDSADMILTILSQNRTEMTPFDEDAIYVLESFIDSEISGKALAIIEALSCHRLYKSAMVASGVLPSILNVLDTQVKEWCEISVRILNNLSYNSDTAYHILYLDWIPKLVIFLGDHSLSKYCLNILNNICHIEEGRDAVAESNSCVTSISMILEAGTKQERETALEVLLSLRYDQRNWCKLAMVDTIVKSLASISVKGNSREKDMAIELLQLLGSSGGNVVSDCCGANTSLGINMETDSSNEQKIKKSTSKGFGFPRRKISRALRRDH